MKKFDFTVALAFVPYRSGWGKKGPWLNMRCSLAAPIDDFGKGSIVAIANVLGPWPFGLS